MLPKVTKWYSYYTNMFLAVCNLTITMREKSVSSQGDTVLSKRVNAVTTWLNIVFHLKSHHQSHHLISQTIFSLQRWRTARMFYRLMESERTLIASCQRMKKPVFNSATACHPCRHCWRTYRAFWKWQRTTRICKKNMLRSKLVRSISAQHTIWYLSGELPHYFLRRLIGIK